VRAHPRHGRAGGTHHVPLPAGEKAVLDGAKESLKQGVVVSAKSHLRFDGLYFVRFDKIRPPRAFYWNPERPGEFNLYRCRDIAITRCFSDGRGAAAPPFILAWLVDDLSVRNCVTTYKNANMEFNNCPGLRIENNVFACPLINAFVLDNKAGQDAVVKNNIFTDNLFKKAALNIALLAVESPPALTLRDNNFFLRALPEEERNVFFLVDHSTRTGRGVSLPAFEKEAGATGSIIADPVFAGVAPMMKAFDEAMLSGNTNDARVARLVMAVKEHQKKQQGMPAGWFPPDFLMNTNLNLKYDFDAFFATNPEVVKRGIGLQPEVFNDFIFD